MNFHKLVMVKQKRKMSVSNVVKFDTIFMYLYKLIKFQDFNNEDSNF